MRGTLARREVEVVGPGIAPGQVGEPLVAAASGLDIGRVPGRPGQDGHQQDVRARMLAVDPVADRLDPREDGLGTVLVELLAAHSDHHGACPQPFQGSVGEAPEHVLRVVAGDAEVHEAPGRP